MMKPLNNRGQVLVLFIVMFPIIFFLIAFFLENMIITGEKNKLNNLNQIVIEYTYQNMDNVGVYDGVLDLVLRNDMDVVIEKFEISDDKIDITLRKNTSSIFGKIVGIRAYEIKSDYNAAIDDEKVIYNRK